MMRRKLLSTIILLLSFATVAPARVLPGGPVFNRLRVGLEWGYTQTFFLARSYTYISDDGYRVYEKSVGFHWSANAQILAQAGYILGERSLVSLCAGYMGMGKDNRLLPLALRYTFFPRAVYNDGFFVYGQGGVAWHVHTTAGKTAVLGVLGGGYRVRLSDTCNLDLLVGLKGLIDRPAIPDPARPGSIPEQNIRRNIAGYCALDFSVAVSF